MLNWPNLSFSKADYIFCDDILPPPCNAYCLMVQSGDSNKPNASNQKFVNFPLRDEFFLPLWSLEEMQNLNHSLLPISPFHIPDPPLPPAACGVGIGAAAAGAPASPSRPPASELESRFFRWGGCVRSVFDICDTWRNEALEALSTIPDLNALNEAVVKVRVNPKALGRLIHLEVDSSSFRPIKSIIGSDLIAEKIAQQKCSKKADDVIAFLCDSRGYGSLAPLSGHFFEAVVHLLLKKGGKFTAKCLDDSSSATTVEFPRKNREIIFRDTRSLDPTETVMFVLFRRIIHRLTPSFFTIAESA